MEPSNSASYYVVTALNSAGESAASPQVSAMPEPEFAVPGSQEYGIAAGPDGNHLVYRIQREQDRLHHALTRGP